MSTVNGVSDNPFAQWSKDASKAANDSMKETGDMFMTLLLAQLQNQDPTNPMDNSQMTAQLAQINTVEGINKLNSSLLAFADQFSASQMLNAVNMIDRQILVSGNRLEFDGTNKMAAAFSIPSGSADRAVISIKDSTGTVVDTIELDNPSTNNFFEWDGLKDDGTPHPAGEYSFSVEATKEGNKVDTAMYAYQKITSVERDGTGAIYVIANGVPVKLSDISEVI